MSTPTLLCYNLKGDRAQVIRQLATGLGISVRAVSPEEYGRSLNCLLGLEAAKDTAFAGEVFEEEMLVMTSFPPALINRFLDTFRQQDIASVKLKAVLTPTNSKWNSSALHDELLKESAAMAQMRAQAHAEKSEDAKEPAAVSKHE